MNAETNNTAAQQPVDDNVINGAITEVKPDNALVVLNPEKYAVELFASFNNELVVAKRKAARATYDVTTKEGMELAKSHRTTFVKIRTRADKAKTEAKRPIDLAGKAILAAYDKLKKAAEEEEAKHNKAIVEEEARIEAEKQRKQEEQRVRTEEIQNRINFIRDLPTMMALSSSEAITKKLEDLSEKRLEPSMYDDHLEDAVNALNGTIDKLRELVQTALAREEAARKAEEDRAELQRLREAQAESDRKAEAERALQAEAAAAIQRQQQQMQDIMEIQNLVAITGDYNVVRVALDRAVAFDPDKYGDMKPMATMARLMAMDKLNTLIDTLSPPVVEIAAVPASLLDDSLFADIPAAPSPSASGVSAGLKFNFLAPQQEAYDVTSDQEIIDVVAQHFGWTDAATRLRLSKIPF